MRLAALYDIHGNLPALEAVLTEVEKAAVDLVLVGGDVLPGPMPRETLQTLLDLALPVRFIHGNGESAVLALLAGKEPVGVPEAYRPPLRWSAEQLTPEQQAHIARWPSTLQVSVDGLGTVLFCHATPRNDTEIFTRQTAEERLVPLFEGLNVPVVLCGHTHMQFDRRIGRTRVVNAGSVGMPFGTPGAYWCLLGPDIELRYTRYGLPRAAQRVRATAYPQAESFADQEILRPRSEAEMLEILGRAELR
jgi:putative phosphoesterase